MSPFQCGRTEPPGRGPRTLYVDKRGCRAVGRTRLPLAASSSFLSLSNSLPANVQSTQKLSSRSKHGSVQSYRRVFPFRFQSGVVRATGLLQKHKRAWARVNTVADCVTTCLLPLFFSLLYRFLGSFLTDWHGETTQPTGNLFGQADHTPNLRPTDANRCTGRGST